MECEGPDPALATRRPQIAGLRDEALVAEYLLGVQGRRVDHGFPYYPPPYYPLGSAPKLRLFRDCTLFRFF